MTPDERRMLEQLGMGDSFDRHSPPTVLERHPGRIYHNSCACGERLQGHEHQYVFCPACARRGRITYWVDPDSITVCTVCGHASTGPDPDCEATLRAALQEIPPCP